MESNYELAKHTATQLSQKLYQNQYLHFEKLVMAIGSQVKNDSS